MVNDPGAIRVGVKSAVPALMPDQSIVFIPDIAVVAVQYFRDKGFWSQFKFL